MRECNSLCFGQARVTQSRAKIVTRVGGAPSSGRSADSMGVNHTFTVEDAKCVLAVNIAQREIYTEELRRALWKRRSARRAFAAHGSRKGIARKEGRRAAGADIGCTNGCRDRLTRGSSSWPANPPRTRRPASPESRKRRMGKAARGESDCASSAYPPSAPSRLAANQGLTRDGS